MGDVLEEGNQVDFLLVIAAERRPFLLADDGDDRLVIELGVVESIQKVDRAGPGGSEADPDLAGKFCVGAGHEGGQFLMPGLDELQGLAEPPERAHDAVDAVARIAKDPPDAPFRKAPE